MNKIIKNTTLIMAVIILIGISFLLFNSMTGETIRDYSWTKAICNETNYCQDYEIVCNGKDIVSITYTGAAIQNSHDWEDPRDKEIIDKLCE